MCNLALISDLFCTFRDNGLSIDGVCLGFLATGGRGLFFSGKLAGRVIRKFIRHLSCNMKDFVESRTCTLRAMLRSRALPGLLPRES